MIKNYLTIAFRTLLKNKVFSFINIFGLALGMAVCLVIAIFINHQVSFDSFHQKKDQIVRLNEVQTFGGIVPQKVALSMYPMGPTLKVEYDEILDYVRFVDGTDLLEYDGKKFFIDKSFYTDPSIFEVFDFELLHGDKKTALIEPNSIVITEKTAKIFFGDLPAIGKVLVDRTRSLKITGILKNIPSTSHLQFDVLLSISTIDNEDRLNNWGSNWLVTYLFLEQGTDVSKMEATFPRYVEKFMGEGRTENYELYLQPLEEVHMGSTDVTHDYNNWQKFDRKYITIFTILAIFVLIIANINFINLTTARSVSRAREVGIRKSVGAHRFQIAKQFIGESVLLAIIALFIALILTRTFLPILNTISGNTLDFNLLQNPVLLLIILLASITIGAMAGIYPAFFLSVFQPVKVLKGEILIARRSTVRNILVVTQFTIAIALMVGTALTLQQFRFMKDSNPGYSREQVLLLPMNQLANENYEILKTEFRDLPGVSAVTASGQRLGNNIHQNSARAKGDHEERKLSPSHLHVDYDFISFYGLEIMAGREFSKEIPTDYLNGYILNESLVNDLNWENPIGNQFGVAWRDTLGTVIGVVKDFNFNSLHHKIQSLYLSIQDWGYNEMSVRISSTDMSGTIQKIEEKWNEIVTGRPFQYSFLDDHFATLYKSDRQVSQVVGVVAVLAILVACLGLFGLSTIATEQRTKEIGIRKVLGASMGDLIVLLSKGFAKLVMVAFIISTPITYLFMNDWLQNFAYQITIGPSVFIFAGILSLAVSILTVAYHAIKAAISNPIESLRYE